VAAIVLPYVLAFRRRRHVDRARKAEAVQLGFDRPTAQYPFIDPMYCIGCGSCVAACPEVDVLGVVGGVATVVNGLRCVGHARCEIACPVGAIKVGLGDVKSRADVPLMDEWHETSVPGMFVAGELTGMALVKNAVSHGRKVVDRIAQRAAVARAPGTGDIYDIAVVGAGPAGLTAAALARERGLSSVVLEQEPDLGGTILHYPRRKLVLVQSLEIPFLGTLREGEYAKEDLLETFQDLTQRASLNVRFGAKVTGVARPNGHFVVRTGGAEFPARFVILALGRRGTPRRLEVPGEELPKVTYQLVDAASYEGKRVLVVGGGDTALEDASYLTRFCSEVIVVHRRDQLRASKIMQERALENPKIRFVWNAVVDQVLGEASPRKVTGARLRDTRTGETSDLAVDGIFVAIGHQPNTGFLAGQLPVNPQGYLLTEPGSTRTAIPGVFAAGDVADPAYRQAVTAAGSGCQAAIDAEHWLAEQAHEESAAAGKT
jgi:thioredoxin reductase/Pyruvate/2-oxoacid:ferredoxin oxidoreductase delta subunit